MGGSEYSSLVAEPQKPAKSTPIVAKFCDYVEKALVWCFDDYSHKKPNYFLKSNFAPTDETDPASNLPVVGTIPVSFSINHILALVQYKPTSFRDASLTKISPIKTLLSICPVRMCTQ